jgi:hypothetical protein
MIQFAIRLMQAGCMCQRLGGDLSYDTIRFELNN